MISKILLLIFTSMIGLTLLYYTPHHSVTINTEIKIVATPNQVWDVITDLQSYPQWNPYHIEATSSLIKGDEIFLSLQWPNGLNFRVSPVVITNNPAQELTWGGGIKPIFHGKHEFLIEQETHSSINFIQRATFTGILTYLIPFRYPEEGYRNMNKALKDRVEGNTDE